MYNKAHIRFVYSHAKRDCCHYDVNLILNKITLYFVPNFTLKTRVITCTIDPLSGQSNTQIVYFPAAITINNTATILLFNKSNRLVCGLVFSNLVVSYIRAVKTSFEDKGLL